MDKPRVLIMENEERVCRVLNRMIEHMGYMCSSVNDYAEFQSVYPTLKPDIVILSPEVPGLDHTDLIDYLLEQHSHALILFLSNLDEDELTSIAELGQLSGLKMGGILRKPVDIDAVKVKLMTLTQQNGTPPVKKKRHAVNGLLEQIEQVHSYDF